MRYGYNSNNLYTPTEKRKILLDWGNFFNIITGRAIAGRSNMQAFRIYLFSVTTN